MSKSTTKNEQNNLQAKSNKNSTKYQSNKTVNFDNLKKLKK